MRSPVCVPGLPGGARRMTDELDPRTPVLVSVGQASERVDAPDYRARSAVDFAAAAVRAALGPRPGDRIDARPAPARAARADGPATIEASTVVHDRAGERTGVVIGRLHDDGRRFVALAAGTELVELLSTGEPVGAGVVARSTRDVNRVELGSVRVA